MSIEEKLYSSLEKWFASRRQVQDWVARHPVASAVDAAHATRFSELRDRCYDCEWELLNLGARKEVWEKALSEESDFDRADAMELRHGVADLDLVSDRQAAAAQGLKVAAWWFIPYAAWVGLPTPSRWPHPADHAQPMLSRVAGAFRDAARDFIPQRVREENQLADEVLRATFQFIPGLCADRLRTAVLPQGGWDDWPAPAQAALDFTPDPESPVRAGCVGVYLAAASYRQLALLRDIVREMVGNMAAENADSHLRLGPLLPRAPALEEAELLRWDLRASQAIQAPLDPRATSRHVSFLVQRRGELPQAIVASLADLDGPRALPDTVVCFSCILGRQGMLHDALAPFVDTPLAHLTWSVHQQAIEDDPPGAIA